MLAARVDLLSQMLDLVRLRGELVFSVDLNQPWALRFQPGSAYFFVVLEGKLSVAVAGEPPVEAIAGDLVMLPRGVGHVLTDGSGAAEANADELMAAQFTDERLGLRHGGNGAQTRLIAGSFHFESSAVPWVVSALPAVIHIEKSGGQTGGWLEGLAHFMMMEAQTVYPGSSVMISRLIDVLIIRVIRTWAQTSHPNNTGWLGALADPRISRALKSIHDEPFRKWSVAELANSVGMSRSSFADRFSSLVQQGPLSYQTRWRLTLAHGFMRQSNARVGDVARRVGYDSEAAFSRAFKAQFGVSPVDIRATSEGRP
ncbi:AraC family transcriptional regulator [Kaistia dalseonensis]|uniref:AraC-like DNA-binding protein n=1 Tax=Kaistia dalseonensis TaxID=410840 RepID=A0ABU0HD89_9HYPH|nr:AraC family transcriptional regulator [Kaistia dalseonensis]MCX5497641.1 AraC family transcriptional regulator [Kaistia dalseonensis]MDQ0440283.1 AraC-like DNA-binding protein [Kaistia dalseonensis]